MQYYELPRWVRDLPVYRPVCKWAEMPTYAGRLDDYVNQTLSAKKFNTEGEKQMEKKIDWHKPLRAFKTPGHEVVDAKVYTYKSGKQRVVWVDERVYPVDDQGRAVAAVDYSANWVRKGAQIVENVPEEKFFLGLARDPDGTYWLTDGGTVGDRHTIVNFWAGAMKRDGEPHWVVDIRKSAEPPKPIAHDPKDWTVIREHGYNRTSSYGMMTESQAEQVAADRDEDTYHVVRVRTTPPPADTARYIQLFRAPGREWHVNSFGGGKQERTWAESGGRTGCAGYEYCNVKVRD